MNKLELELGLEIEQYPFEPILPIGAKVMMMGSFPPKSEKHGMNLHYPNFQNDMWRIYGGVFFDNPHHFYQSETLKAFDSERILAFLHEQEIASHPTVLKAIREKNNASDKFLKVVEAVDLTVLLPKVPECKWIFTTGEKATEILLSQLSNPPKLPKTNEWIDFPIQNRELKLYRLPSSSRAYPLSLNKKIEAYRAFFELAGMV